MKVTTTANAKLDEPCRSRRLRRSYHYLQAREMRHLAQGWQRVAIPCATLLSIFIPGCDNFDKYRGVLSFIVARS